MQIRKTIQYWPEMLAALIGLVVGLLVYLVFAGPAHSATISPRVSTCGARASAEYLQPISETWIYGSTCPSKTLQYNQTYCVYKFNVGNGWVNGPIRTGNGSINSNNSRVSCTAHGSGNPYHIRMWFNINGSGWALDTFR